ncbi:MAG: FISUMP domain-containing protein [Patescibacteria group bacterium]
MLKFKKAFTLIELLVVIAIIGILATVSVVALSNARSKSRDTKRVGDMKQIQTALELFINDNGRYPTEGEWAQGSLFSTSSLATTTYLQVIPTAVTPTDGVCTEEQNSFSYASVDNGSSYSISFCLGNTIGFVGAGPNILTPGGMMSIPEEPVAQYTLIYLAGYNGSLTGITSQTVNSGGSGTEVVAIPNSGYSFEKWSDNDSTNATRTDTNVAGNINTTASFVCAPNCEGKNCGSDSCGATCGSCTGQDICTNGVCGAPPFDCGTSQVTVTSLGNYTCGANDLCVYDTVEIGTQCWLKQNINIGARVNGASNQSNNSSLEKYCYSDNLNNCTTYGALYQWGEAMQYSVLAEAQGVCPTGWHIPTDGEQNTLDQYLTDPPNTCNASRSSNWECNSAGGKLKEVGTSHWDTPNVATDSFGFAALPAGNRLFNGVFADQGLFANFWSSSVSGPTALSRSLLSAVASVSRYSYGQTYGFSVRCLKDNN